ncbi:hypothetical protein K4A83_17035 [Spirulina subsalsa FACHB-351]|uniref:Uncharacterized protein n=1 Tax=Spirulina subsalsa FACHB-351 TaxID=234711 RepID=A0ABT3L8Z1_9CYAN|nr:hypothetical protein [Spirulina subsalsa]MCW6037965.1 hypothetical protein [Spirulina subsalsa FACHB-351]
MLSETHYLIRSLQNGQYLVARPHGEIDRTGYLLLFHEHYEALSYLNTHGQDVANQFAVECLGKPQVRGLLDRWGFQGVGLVRDPLIPQIDFLRYDGMGN